MTNSPKFPDIGTIFSVLACFFIGLILIAATWNSPTTEFVVGGIFGFVFFFLGMVLLFHHKKF